METRHKVLLVDDDPAMLESYRELLSRLPSEPEVHTAGSGSRAIAMMEDEDYRLLICDLKMPRMDGLQVLSIVRRKFPQVRTVALTGVHDEHFRSRVYGLGVDMFWYKPDSETELNLFKECLESLLGQDTEGGFRGVQSKSLVDIIQLECMSQSSSVLRINNGALSGKVWILDGELIDAEAGDLKGEEAFRKLFSWQNGTFETLPAEPGRTRAIFKEYNGLLLECAQVLDEARNRPAEEKAERQQEIPGLSEIEGIEFLLAHADGGAKKDVARGLENPKRIGSWCGNSLARFRTLGERLHAGPLISIECVGPQRQVTLAHEAGTEFCIGWKNSMEPEIIRELAKKVYSLWAS